MRLKAFRAKRGADLAQTTIERGDSIAKCWHGATAGYKIGLVSARWRQRRPRHVKLSDYLMTGETFTVRAICKRKVSV